MRLPLTGILIMVILTLIIDGYIYYDVRSMSGKPKRKRNGWLYIASCVPCWALLVVAFSLPLRDEGRDVIPVMWLLFTYLTIIAAKTVYVLCSLIGRLCNIGSRRLSNYGAMLGVPLGLLVCGTMWYGVMFTRHNIDVKNIDIASEKLPASFNGYRIVQFSDLHTGTWGSDTAFVSKLVDSINALQPDVIMFTGDIVNRKTCELEPFRKVLQRLKAKDGVYSILGNHDYGDYVDWSSAKSKAANLQQLKDRQGEMGWKMLNNSHEFIKRGNDSIAVIGVENWGEPPFGQYGDLVKAYRGKGVGLKDGNFKILMTHNPEHWNQVVKKNSNIDLSLSGHTHAMQIEADMFGQRFSPAAWRYKYWGGLYEDTGADGTPSRLYVNIGAGEVGMPMRLGAEPELTVITLRKK